MSVRKDERAEGKLALSELAIRHNKTKTKIFPVTEPIRFLGFDFRLTETGKVIVTINPQNVKSERKKLRRLVAKCKKGEIPRESVNESYRCWRQHASYGNSYKLITRMDKYYRELWKEAENAENHEENVPVRNGRTDQSSEL